MKHTFKVTLTLILFFLTAQFVGLLIVNQYIDHKKTDESGQIVMKPLPYNFERPQVENQSVSFIYIVIAIIFGTSLVLLLIKFNKPVIWRVWFFITVWVTLLFAFSAFINQMVALVLALVISALKILRPNLYIQNISEIFIYGGLASIFVPIINVFGAFMLLILISVYDFIAVYKTKHMIKLANFQSESKVFAGLLIPYDRKKDKIALKESKIEVKQAQKQVQKSPSTHQVAVLGGGDIGFSLMFSGAVMKALMLKETMVIGFLKTLIIPICAAIALYYLLIKGKKNTFYPAMPFITVGCFIGFLIIQLIP